MRCSSVIETLQGASIPASLLEREVLPARIEDYQPGELDMLASAGEVAWVGVGSLGERDGRVALYLTDALPRLLRPSVSRAESVKSVANLGARERAILARLTDHGASFFGAIHEAVGGGYPAETVDALWTLVWRGLVTNDTFHSVRAYTRPPEKRARKPSTGGRAFRSRRMAPAAAEGRWSLVAARVSRPVSPTEWSAAVAEQLLIRYGLVTREVAGAEDAARRILRGVRGLPRARGARTESGAVTSCQASARCSSRSRPPSRCCGRWPRNRTIPRSSRSPRPIRRIRTGRSSAGPSRSRGLRGAPPVPWARPSSLIDGALAAWDRTRRPSTARLAARG